MKSKFIHSIVSLFVSLSSAAYSWFAIHGVVLATAISVVAGLYSIRATQKTIALRKKQWLILNQVGDSVDRNYE